MIRNNYLAILILCFFAMIFNLSTYRTSSAGELSTFITEQNNLDFWTGYIFSHQTSKRHISYETAEKIASSAIIASANYGVGIPLILSVIQTESGFNPNARSRTGARGLMQVIAFWHKKDVQGRSLFNINTSIDVGTHILREYLDQTGGNIKLALMYYRGSKGRAGWKYYAKVNTNKREIVASLKEYSRDIDMLSVNRTGAVSVSYAGCRTCDSSENM